MSSRILPVVAKSSYRAQTVCGTLFSIAKNLKPSKSDAYEGFVTLYGDPEEGTDDIRVRVIAVKLDTGETE